MQYYTLAVAMLLTRWNIGYVTGQQLSSTNGTWVQIGADINGDTPYSKCGSSVALSGDGTTVAAGIPGTTGVEGYGTGSARVYQSNRTSIPATRRIWTQRGADINGTVSDGRFGSSLAMSANGNRMIVGVSSYVYGWDTTDRSTGYVRVVEYNITSGRWDQVGSGSFVMVAMGTAGISDVAMSADGMVIAINALSSPLMDGVSGTSTVSVYGLNSTTAEWEQRGAAIVTPTSFIESSKVALSADGMTLVVGSPTVGQQGQVIVRKYSPMTKQWRPVGPAINGRTGDGISCNDDISFGSDVSVSADGTTVGIAAAADGGFVLKYRMFRYSMMNKTWDQIGSDIVDEEYNCGLQSKGLSISLTANGRTVAVGSGGWSQNFRSAIGRTRVFTYDINGIADWAQVGSDIVGETSEDRSGSSVALSSDGRILAIGAHRNVGNGDAFSNDSRGHVRVFEFQPSKVVTVINSTIHCTYGWNLYNSITETLVAPLTNEIVISNPPPCNRTNIEAVIQCKNNQDGFVSTTTNTTSVVLELYNANGTKLLHRRNERAVKYFLFGNNGINNVLNGRIPAGTYMIRASLNVTATSKVMMMTSPFTKFTLGGTCV